MKHHVYEFKGWAGTKDEVWTKIANLVNQTCNKEITPASVRVRVALNRGNIKEKLGIIATVIKKPQDEDIIHGKTN